MDYFTCPSRRRLCHSAATLIMSGCPTTAFRRLRRLCGDRVGQCRHPCRAQKPLQSLGQRRNRAHPAPRHARVRKAQPERVQERPSQPELPQRSVRAAFAILHIAEDWRPSLRQVPTDLVPPTGAQLRKQQATLRLRLFRHWTHFL